MTPGDKFTDYAKLPPGRPGGSRRNPMVADESHISGHPTPIVSFAYGVVLTFPAFRVSESSSFDSGEIISRLCETTASATRRKLAEADGTTRNLTEAIFPPTPTSIYRFRCRFCRFRLSVSPNLPRAIPGINLRITRNRRQGDQAEAEEAHGS